MNKENKNLLSELLVAQAKQMIDKNIYPNYYSIPCATFYRIEKDTYIVKVPNIEAPIYGGTVRHTGNMVFAHHIYTFTLNDLQELKSLGFVLFENDNNIDIHTIIEPQDIDDDDINMLSDYDLHMFSLAYAYHSYFCDLGFDKTHSQLFQY